MATLQESSPFQEITDKLFEIIQRLQLVELYHFYPNIVEVLHNLINQHLPNLYNTLIRGDENECNICMDKKPVIGMPCCRFNLCTLCGERLVSDQQFKCPQCRKMHPEMVLTSFLGNVCHQVTLVETAVHMYQTRNAENLGMTKEEVHEWLACIDNLLSLERREEQKIKILEKMVYFGLIKQLCHLFREKRFRHYKFRLFLNRLILRTNNQRHREQFETIRERLTGLCNSQIPLTFDSCEYQLHLANDIMNLVAQVFSILVFPLQTGQEPSETFNDYFQVPLSANALINDMEGLQRNYLTSLVPSDGDYFMAFQQRLDRLPSPDLIRACMFLFLLYLTKNYVMSLIR